MAQPKVILIDEGLSVLFQRPFMAEGPGYCEIRLEQLKFWLAGSRGGMDPDDPRKQELPGVSGEWIYVLGGPLSRKYDHVNSTYWFDGPFRDEETIEDISWAYFSAYAAHQESIRATMVKNPAYAAQRDKQWKQLNKPTNSESFNETPLPVEPIPPLLG